MNKRGIKKYIYYSANGSVIQMNDKIQISGSIMILWISGSKFPPPGEYIATTMQNWLFPKSLDPCYRGSNRQTTLRYHKKAAATGIWTCTGKRDRHVPEEVLLVTKPVGLSWMFLLSHFPVQVRMSVAAFLWYHLVCVYNFLTSAVFFEILLYLNSCKILFIGNYI